MKQFIFVTFCFVMLLVFGCGSTPLDETPTPDPAFVNPVLTREEDEGAFHMPLKDICGSKVASECETDWDQGMIDFLSGAYASEIEGLKTQILAEGGEWMLDMVSTQRWYILSPDSRVDSTFELIVRLNLEPYCPLEGELPGSGGGDMRNEACMEIVHVQTEGFILIDITKEFPEVIESGTRDRTN